MEVKQRTFADYNKEVETANEQPTVTATETNNAAPITENVNAVATDVPAANVTNVEAPAANSPQATPVVENAAPITDTQDDVIAFEMPDDSAQQQQPAETQPQVPSWKEALKDEAQKAEILKELGLDLFTLELNEHIKRGGKPADYLNAKAIDWNTVSDEQIAKAEFAKDFPADTPKAQLDRLFNKKYNQTDLADDEDKEDGLLMMRRDANLLRSKLIAEQAKFKLPEPQQQQPAQVQPNPQQEAANKASQEFLDKLLNSEATKSLFQSKKVAINLGEGVKPVNVSIQNPAALMDTLFKPVGRTPQGEPDVQFWQELALFMSNPTQFKQIIRNSAKELAKQDLVSEGQNATVPTKVIPMNATQYSNAGEAFNNGTIKVGKLGNYDRNAFF